MAKKNKNGAKKGNEAATAATSRSDRQTAFERVFTLLDLDGSGTLEAEELLALEQVRVDKAMGKLGGRAAAAAAPGGAAPSAGRGYVPLRAEAAPPSHEEVQGAISAARIRYGVQRRRGGPSP